MSDPQNSAPADDAADLGDDPTVKPSQENDVDTDWLLDLAVSEDAVAGVVGWANLGAPDAPGATGAGRGNGAL